MNCITRMIQHKRNSAFSNEEMDLTIQDANPMTVLTTSEVWEGTTSFLQVSMNHPELSLFD